MQDPLARQIGLAAAGDDATAILAVVGRGGRSLEPDQFAGSGLHGISHGGDDGGGFEILAVSEAAEIKAFRAMPSAKPDRIRPGGNCHGSERLRLAIRCGFAGEHACNVIIKLVKVSLHVDLAGPGNLPEARKDLMSERRRISATAAVRDRDQEHPFRMIGRRVAGEPTVLRSSTSFAGDSPPGDGCAARSSIISGSFHAAEYILQRGAILQARQG